jgi:hypothetical protein
MLVLSTLVCFLIGLVVGYLRGHQRRRFGLRGNSTMILILIGLAVYSYAINEYAVLFLLGGWFVANLLSAMLGSMLGGVMGKRTGRLPSWIVW